MNDPQPLSTDAERAEFERRMGGANFKRNADGNYVNEFVQCKWWGWCAHADALMDPKREVQPLYTAEQVFAMGRVPLNEREVGLLDEMIAVQLSHAKRCDNIANRAMAEKQKEWDMERVALLMKIKQGGQHGADKTGA